MNPMKLTAYVTILLIASMLIIAVQTASAQNDTILVGVKPGDQFTYTVTGSHSSNAPIGSVPEEVLNAEASTSFTITIVNASTPNIGYTYVWRFTNGTEQTGDGINNIEIPSESVGPFWPIVPANLTAGEKIHIHFADQSEFNETIRWTYTNYTRETNHLQTETQEQNNQSAVTLYRTVESDAYFDKITGMLVSLNDQTYYQNPSFQTTITWKLVGQTVWTSDSAGSYPPEPFWTLPVIVSVGVVIGVVVVGLGLFASSKMAAAKRRKLLKKK
jgi:hypothetical protein